MHIIGGGVEEGGGGVEEGGVEGGREAVVDCHEDNA